MAPLLPEFFGGSADLTGSNLTNFSGSRQAARDEAGNHLSYGVREFGMAAIMNGMALHGGYLPYGGTFLTFSDYSRNALRMAALMNQRVIHVFTHDSIGVGEDGPTHQSVEHVSSLRLIPNLDVWRPADSLETAVAWASAVENRNRPTALALSRQGTPPVATSASRADEIRRGGYVLRSAADAGADKAVAVIIGTGTETAVALAAQERLAEQGIGVDVVSMPSTTVFDRQDDEWQSRVLPPDLPAVAVEAGHPDFWRKYVGRRGKVIGIDRYGESAPGDQLYRHFGITADNVAAAVRAIVGPS
jgi:transketolase